MGKQDSRTALRLPNEQRLKIEQLIREGKFKNISQVIRTALKEFLSENKKLEGASNHEQH